MDKRGIAPAPPTDQDSLSIEVGIAIAGSLAERHAHSDNNTLDSRDKAIRLALRNFAQHVKARDSAESYQQSPAAPVARSSTKSNRVRQAIQTLLIYTALAALALIFVVIFKKYLYQSLAIVTFAFAGIGFANGTRIWRRVGVAMLWVVLAQPLVTNSISGNANPTIESSFNERASGRHKEHPGTSQDYELTRFRNEISPNHQQTGQAPVPDNVNWRAAFKSPISRFHPGVG